MTLTITIRIPDGLPLPAGPTTPAAGRGRTPAASQAGVTDMLRLLRTLLPLVEPAAMLVADAAGLGLCGQIVCATALRSARQVLAA
jgi:hypothetical protein